jgi:UDP-N-acetylmuramoyl-tripeptide--D-alanyl-D-alanine ligase
MEIQELYSLWKQHPSVQTDSRKVKTGDIFFALQGPNFNGNLFAKQALHDGAVYAVVDEDLSFEDERIIRVEDVLTTLQHLASHHRDQFSIPFIGITGSNGKTTTKELIHQVLSSFFRTYTTEGNLNNHIGIPITILKIKEDAQIAVIEMGANHLGEIAGYCKYAKPTHGLITNCGKAHLEGFGSEEGVRKGKGELFDYLAAHQGTAFVNADLEYLLTMSQTIASRVMYGSVNAEVNGEIVQSAPLLEMKITGKVKIDSIKTNLVGGYNSANVLAAVTVGNFFGVSAEDIRTSLEAYVPSNSRSQMIKKGSNIFILDAYNANPSSMKVAVENFHSMNVSEKVLMLGGMKELGADTKKEHKALIDLINQYEWKRVVLVGGEFDDIKHDYITFDNSLQAKDWLQRQHFENTTILVKGSRSLKMEHVLEI